MTTKDSKQALIAKIFNDPAGFGSNTNTLKRAKQLYKTITIADIKKWKNKNVERKTQFKGENSFVASKPYQEYQMDLMFFYIP